ncbi:MAG: glycosyltransferase [Candidatus Ratteibacteria bacterium]|jgi:glycosyltransferase involved in cell wall biosynthesis
MKTSTLSVILTNYNHGKYIGGALEGIIGQFFKPLEIIVIDDGSTDDSVKIIEDFIKREPCMRLIKHEKNMGVQYNLRYLTELPKGEYVYSAAADDKVLPGFFEKSMKLLARYPQAGLCCSDPVFFRYDNDAVIHNRLSKNIKEGYLNPDTLVNLFKNTPFWIAGHTSIVKTSALIKSGGYLPQLKWYCDWFVSIVVAFRCGICYIPEPLASMRVSAASYSASGVKIGKEKDEVFTNLLNLLTQKEYEDIFPFFKKSTVFLQLHPDVLLTIIKNPKYISLLSPLFIWKVLREKVIRMVRSIWKVLMKLPE